MELVERDMYAVSCEDDILSTGDKLAVIIPVGKRETIVYCYKLRGCICAVKVIVQHDADEYKYSLIIKFVNNNRKRDPHELQFESKTCLMIFSWKPSDAEVKMVHEMRLRVIDAIKYKFRIAGNLFICENDMLDSVIELFDKIIS